MWHSFTYACYITINNVTLQSYMLISKIFKRKGEFLISDKTAELVQDILLEHR
jgi:hypothetical protein